MRNPIPIAGSSAVATIFFAATVLVSVPRRSVGFFVSSTAGSSRIIRSRISAGKGDDTIKELNKLDSIFIDPFLVQDPAFWDYCLVPNEQGPMRLGILQLQNNNEDVLHRNENESLPVASFDRLVECGATEDDVSFYQETYGVFRETTTVFASGSATTTTQSPLPKNSGLVVRADTLQSMEEDQVKLFSKVIRVLRDWDEEGEEEDQNDGVLAAADIEVSSLGELRALTICSYAYLTKKC